MVPGLTHVSMRWLRLAPPLPLGWLCAILAWAICGIAQAQPAAVAVGDADDSIELARHGRLYEDPSGKLRPADLANAKPSERRADGGTLSFGYSPSAWWLHVRLRNAGTESGYRLLDVGSPLQDYVDVYVLRDGRTLAHVETGDRRPFANRPIAQRSPVLPLQLAPGETVDVWIRLAAYDGLHEAVKPVLWKASAYAQDAQTQTLIFGLYYGLLLTIMAYTLFLFVSTWQGAFGWYVAYILAFLAWSVTFRGYGFQYFWPRHPDFNNQFLAIAAAASYATCGVFLIYFLDTRRHAGGGMHKVIAWSSAFAAAWIVPALFGVYALTFVATIPAGLVLIGAGLATGIAQRHGIQARPARYYLVAVSMLSFGAVLYWLRMLGVLPSNVVTENALQIGSALEVLLLAFGLADQMNILRAEKLLAEQTALRAQAELAHRLEHEVQERTQELESANRRLNEMAITDELTGAYNRRHFNTVFAAEIARHNRHRAPFAFCLLDVDHFKAYNDHYGHQKGDEVLRRLSSHIRTTLRRSGDQFFRLGGEEFGVVFTIDEPPDKAQAFVERIREGIAELGIPHEHNGGGQGVVTASFGLVILGGETRSMQPEGVYALADQLLYRAKAEGRNRVVTQMV